jgi:hypothetical protein
MNCFHALGRWDRGFESHLGHGCLVCVCVYSVFVLTCGWVAALRRVDHSSKESYRLWKMITELNKRPGPWMGWKSHWKKKICFSDIKSRFYFEFVSALINKELILQVLERLCEHIRRKRPNLWPDNLAFFTIICFPTDNLKEQIFAQNER